jgi:hypothetical protein
MVDRLFDLVICGLLLVTIAHLALVQRRLRAFRAERDRLQAFVTALDLTVERAESAIRRMRPLAGAEGATEAAAAKPRVVRERAPEDLLKAARAAAGVAGARGERRTTEPAAPGARGGKRAASLADALQDAVGS